MFRAATAQPGSRSTGDPSRGTPAPATPGTLPPTAAATVAALARPSAEHSSSKSDSTTYAISKTLHRSVEPAGRVRRIAAAVLVDDAVEVTEQAGKRVTTRRKRTVGGNERD